MVTFASTSCFASVRHRWALRLVPGVLLWLGVAGCGPTVATPIPQPPISAFPLDAVGAPKADPNDRTRVVFGNRQDGSAKTEPVPGSVIRVTDLDSTAPSVDADIATDGSFSLSAPVAVGDELRFQAILNGVPGTPSDAILTETGTELALVPSPRFACLTLFPAGFVGFGAGPTGEIRVHNGCTDVVSLDSTGTRLGLPDFALTSALPIDLQPGTDATLTFSFTRSAVGEREDTLFLRVSRTTEVLRYPITLNSEEAASPAPPGK